MSKLIETSARNGQIHHENGRDLLTQQEDERRWFKSPTLVTIDQPQVLTKDVSIISPLHRLTRELQNQITARFGNEDCRTIPWQPPKLPRKGILFRRGHTTPDVTTQHAVILNPVLLGKLHPEIEEALADTISANPRFSDDEIKRRLKENLPEKFPFIKSVGSDVCDDVGITTGEQKELFPNFVNCVAIDDTNGVIRRLSTKWIQILEQSFMAKLGSFKNVIVPYVKDDQYITADTFIMSTLEGGTPKTNLDELASLLMAFGSTKPAEKPEPMQGQSIAKEQWTQSNVVNGLISLGRFLGNNDLLSPPVKIEDYVKGWKLRIMLEKLAGYSKQAEGAFMAFDPEIQSAIGEQILTGVPIVTCSGKFGAVKTNLSYEDLVAIALRLGEKNTMYSLPVGDKKPNGASVEADEFMRPIYKLAKKDTDKYTVKLSRVFDAQGQLIGYRKDPKGDIVAPAIRGIIHKHRGLQYAASDGSILKLEIDIQKYPPSGCGSDGMQETSEEMMIMAIDEWKKQGCVASAAEFGVTNHGSNTLIFWKENKDGIIPLDPFEQFKELVNDKKLVFKPEVPQVAVNLLRKRDPRLVQPIRIKLVA